MSSMRNISVIMHLICLIDMLLLTLRIFQQIFPTNRKSDLDGFFATVQVIIEEIAHRVQIIRKASHFLQKNFLCLKRY